MPRIGAGFRGARMWLLLIPAVALLLPTPASAGWVLFDWSVNIDGTTYNPPGLPASVNSAGFDFNMGLGSLIIHFDTPGQHYAGVYFSHFFDAGFMNVTDAYAAAIGAAPAGLTYQLGWPGMGSPTVFDNFAGNALDMSNTVGGYSPPPNACCDVAMALIYSFSLDPGLLADIPFSAGTVPPEGIFYLQETDHDSGNSVYLSQSFQTENGGEIPEPGCWQLIIAGAALLLAARGRLRA